MGEGGGDFCSAYAARLKGHRVGVGVNATMSVEVGAVDICAWDNMKIIKNICI